MLTLFTAPFVFVRALLKPAKELAVENLALRQQLAVLNQGYRLVQDYFDEFERVYPAE